MVEALSQYSIGNWVVHHSYGFGQVKKIEKKNDPWREIGVFSSENQGRCLLVSQKKR